MNTKWFRMILIVTLISICALPIGSPAYAKAPVKEYMEFDTENNELYNCGDFKIIENSHSRYSFFYFYDKGGNFRYVQTHFAFSGTLSNSETGKSVTDAPDHQTYMYYADGSLDMHGLFFSINIPGAGIAVLDAGTVTFDPDGNITLSSGPHHLLTDGVNVDFTAICDVLR